MLSSISSGLGFWSVSHTSIYEIFKLNVLKNINFLEKNLITDQMIY